jgi:hypothetical protein
MQDFRLKDTIYPNREARAWRKRIPGNLSRGKLPLPIYCKRGSDPALPHTHVTAGGEKRWLSRTSCIDLIGEASQVAESTDSW